MLARMLIISGGAMVAGYILLSEHLYTYGFAAIAGGLFYMAVILDRWGVR